MSSNEMIMSPTLDYPFKAEPQTGDGSAVEVAPGVLWFRMALFASLPWINVWAIAEEGGWSVVDTGLHSAKTIEARQAAFVDVLGNAPVLRVVATHMHPDHCGMSGWMVERFKTRLWMSRLEYLTCRLMAADTGRPDLTRLRVRRFAQVADFHAPILRIVRPVGCQQLLGTEPNGV